SSIAPSMRSCCGICRLLAARSRRCTTTRALGGRWRCSFPPKISWCPTARQVLRRLSGSRM
ncbi:MAG: hypothetical protein ACK55Z_25070, partial [bacterium]